MSAHIRGFTDWPRDCQQRAAGRGQRADPLPPAPTEDVPGRGRLFAQPSHQTNTIESFGAAEDGFGAWIVAAVIQQQLALAIEAIPGEQRSVGQLPPAHRKDAAPELNLGSPFSPRSEGQPLQPGFLVPVGSEYTTTGSRLGIGDATAGGSKPAELLLALYSCQE
jgi:hypothetical protein